MDTNLLKTIFVLLIFSCFFCLLATTDLGFDPIDDVILFIGGIVSIGWVTLAFLNVFEN